MPSYDSDNPGNDTYIPEDLVPEQTWPYLYTYNDVGGTDTIVFTGDYTNPSDYGTFTDLQHGGGDGVNAPWRAFTIRRSVDGGGNPIEIYMAINGRIENVIGGPGTDSINGNWIDNLLQGDADDVAGGNDAISGGKGNDTLVGMGGSDLLYGTSTWDTNPFNDHDLLIGDSDPYTQQSVNIAAGDDTLYGGAGDDTLFGGPGNNHLDGGDGYDTADYGRHIPGDPNYHAIRVAVNLGAGTAQAVQTDLVDGAEYVIASDTITGIERVYGGEGNDTLIGDGFSNHLYGAWGNDVLAGADGNDGLYGADGDDRLTGGNGQDELSGDTGNDTLNGGNDIDTLNGGDGNDSLLGGSGNDWLYGDDGVDTLHGGDGNDTLYSGPLGSDESVNGGAGSDRIYSTGTGRYDGGTGNDIVFAAPGGAIAELLDGGDGIDSIDATGLAFALRLDLQTGATGIALKTFSNFENARTGNAADRILGTAGANLIDSGGGDDTVNGRDGDDTIMAGPGADSLNGAGGFDIVSYWNSTAGVAVSLATNTAAGGDATGDAIAGFEAVEGSGWDDTLAGSDAANRIWGGDGADSIQGGGGHDTLSGGAWNDTIDGGSGNDTLSGDTGANLIIGDDGIDTVDYSVFEINPFLVNLNVNINLAAGTATVKAQDYDTGTVYTLATDIIAAVENVIGTGGNDTITGSTEANRVEGGDGIDLLKGGAGNDTLRGGSGADNMAGGTGNDTYYADDSGDKTIEKTGQGTDTVYSTASWTLGSNVEILRLQGRGDLAGTGNSLDNRLFGNEGANLLRGGNGDDALSGGAGGDTLEGGAGNDTLTGGSGADVFRFAAKAPTGADRITDFDGAVDRFDLSGAAFSALAVAANGDTVLTHASGTVRIVGISGLTLAEWNAFVGTEGLSVTETTASSDSWPATHPIVHRFDTFDWFQA